ncbi:hypothetical protein Scep_017586 [Stephania cephalantha]|uniref:Uncharacterized protein n=1 Tax=Stephania cephalantha TaxID=152367 RepID=A0AAP0IR63_9MAGN
MEYQSSSYTQEDPLVSCGPGKVDHAAVGFCPGGCHPRRNQNRKGSVGFGGDDATDAEVPFVGDHLDLYLVEAKGIRALHQAYFPIPRQGLR